MRSNLLLVFCMLFTSAICSKDSFESESREMDEQSNKADVDGERERPINIFYVNKGIFNMEGNQQRVMVVDNSLRKRLSVLDASPKSRRTVEKNKCETVLKQVAKPESDFSLVGHAIHSMSLRDLRKFDPHATVINFVPTINRDTTSGQALLEHAADIITPDDEMFLTVAMKTLNYGLSHMDEKNWYMKGYTTLEKIVHDFHMQEVWARALKQFELIKSSPPSSSACECVLDVENNGILKFLRFTALAIREPALIYGGDLGSAASDSDIPYDLHYDFFAKNWHKKSWDDLLMKDKQDAMPHLNDTAAWKKWKEMGCTTPPEDYNNALFLYCAIRKAHQQ